MGCAAGAQPVSGPCWVLPRAGARASTPGCPTARSPYAQSSISSHRPAARRRDRAARAPASACLHYMLHQCLVLLRPRAHRVDVLPDSELAALGHPRSRGHVLHEDDNRHEPILSPKCPVSSHGVKTAASPLPVPARRHENGCVEGSRWRGEAPAAASQILNWRRSTPRDWAPAVVQGIGGGGCAALVLDAQVVA